VTTIGARADPITVRDSQNQRNASVFLRRRGRRQVVESLGWRCGVFLA